MIFVDSNLFVIDLRYPDDADYRVNRRALDRLAREGTGMTGILNVLELCGILSFNLSAAALHALYVHFAQRYRMTLVPGGGYDTRLPAPTVRDVLAKMEKRMALKDAEIALVVEQHASSLDAFVTWNAKHFAGKLAVPALTPREWLRRRVTVGDSVSSDVRPAVRARERPRSPHQEPRLPGTDRRRKPQRS